MRIDWNLVATWAQAISSTVVLFMIYFQIRQVNTQIVQSDEQEKFRRSWEFVKLYRDELREDEIHLLPHKEGFEPLLSPKDGDAFAEYIQHFYWPRYHLFVLLNQLVEHQQVDERLLFGYLEDDFNRFVELGITQYGLEAFKSDCGPKLRLLLALWGSQIRSKKLLYGTTQGMAYVSVEQQSS